MNKIVRKAFKKREINHFVEDIEEAIVFYEVMNDIIYFTVKAVLSLPVLATANNFILTLQQVLNLFDPGLRALMQCYDTPRDCQRAIEVSLKYMFVVNFVVALAWLT